MSQVFDVDHVLAQLTLEEKASLTSGSDFWHTAGASSALGVPAVHGHRRPARPAQAGRRTPTTSDLGD